MQQTDWRSVIECDNVNESYNKFVEIFLDKLKKCCPKENKMQGKKKRNNHPWMTTGLQNACKKKNLLYRNFIKNRTDECETRYKTYKNKLTKILKRCEREHYSNKLNEHKNNTKAVWKILNNIINKRTKPQPKPHYFTQNNAKICGKENIANGFNDFFTNVGPNLAAKIGQSDKHFKDF